MKNLSNLIRSRAARFVSLRVVLILCAVMIFVGFGAASAWNGGFGWLSIRKASTESKAAPVAVVPQKDTSETQGSDLVTATSYPFTSGAGTLEDMSTGSTTIVSSGQDDATSAIADMGFDFWFDGVRYSQFSANANGLIKLGPVTVTTAFTNSIASSTDIPKIAPYWDDISNGVNGKVHYKVVGAAPTRKLVVEWQNNTIPRSVGSTGAATFQAWLYESTGKIEFVYGSGIIASGSYSVGIGSSATSFASVTTTGPTVSYVTANDTNAGAIASGTKYTFTPVVPADPTFAPQAMTFTAVGLNTMTLNWVDNATTEVGYAVYRSVDGGVSYQFVTQTAANAVSSVQGGLASNTTYFWKVYAVTEGALSNALTGSQATTTGVVTGIIPVGPTGTFATIGAAVAAINTTGLAGNVILELQPTYVSGVEAFPLVINTLGSPTNTITIRPGPGAVGLVITSAAAQTLNLNGATNVTIDGRVGGAGASQLTIANTVSPGSAIQFINDAQRNTIESVTVQSVEATNSSGTIVFSTTTGVTGNDNNTINNCDIKDGATTPAHGIYGLGTTTTGLLQNSGNSITNNRIFNYFSATLLDAGINLAAGNTEWTITGNSFYQTVAPRTATAGNTHFGILIDGTSANQQSNGHSITGNFIGGGAPSAGGTAWTIAGAFANRFIGISLRVGSTPTSVQNNTIANFSWTSTSGATTLPGVWCGIFSQSGTVNIGNASGNTIGGSASTGSIANVISTTGGVDFGIVFTGSSTIGGVHNVSNNNIGSLTLTGSTASISHSFIGIQDSFGNATINNNTIGSSGTANSINLSTAGTGTTNQFINGVISASSGSAVSITNNTFANWNNAYAAAPTTAAPAVRGISSTSGIHTITGNTLRNWTAATLTAGTTTASAIVGISQTSTTGVTPTSSQIVSQNTIHSLSSTAATAVVNVIGIHFTGATATGVVNVIGRNFVHSLSVASTGTSATIIGINAAGGLSQYQNNMVRLGLDSTGSSLTQTTLAILGISDAGTSLTNNFYHNSVYIGGTASTGAGTATSFGYRRTATGTTDVKNNALVNVRTNAAGTGKHYIIGINSLTTFTSNTNDFFNNGGSGQIFGLVVAADQAAFAANWKPTTSQDAGSVFGDPQFINPTGTATFAPLAVVDLHIHPTNPTPVEGAGTLIASVTDDFDAETRSTLTPVDIGADAGNFVVLDLAPPSISYTPLGNVTSTANRSFTGVTITDASGVNGAPGTRPRVYYKKFADAANSFTDNTSGTAGWKYAEANGSTSPFDFTIDYSRLFGGTVSTGDVIQYFVVAQDLAPIPNVGINSGSFNTTPTSVNLTGAVFPITGSIRSYAIAAAVTGTKTVCSAGFPTCDFGSLTNTGGVFEAINNNVVTGNVTILISSNLTGESGTVALNQTAEELVASIYSITIKPSAGGPWSITGTGTGGALIKLNGADNVTIDGSMTGGTDRSLTLNNPNAATGTGTLFIGSLGVGAGATNNTIKNCIIQTGSAGTTAIFTFDIFVGDTTGAAAGADNDNLLIQNNQLIKARTGIQAVGAAGGVLDNLQITGNLIGDPVASTSVGRNPMVLSTINASSITGNTIQNIGFAADTGSAIGISLVTSTLSTISKNTITGIIASGSSIQPTGIAVSTATTNLSITENTIDSVTNSGGSVGPQGINVGSGVTNSSVTRNKVSNIIYSGTGGYGGKGIEINTLTNPSNILVANNFVSNIKGDCFGTGSFTKDTVMGIRVIGAGTGGVNVYHNTVYLGSGGFASTQTSTASMAFYVESTVAGALNVRNNIFVNNLDNTSDAADHNYAFFSDAVAGAFTDINFNDYWVPASTAGGPQTLGFIGSNRILLTDIQTGTTKDASSQNMDPMVLSPAFSPELVSDLHLSPGSPVQALAQPLVGIVNNDFDNDLRDTAPDIGADEIVAGRSGTIPAGTYRDGVIGTAGLAGDTTFTGAVTLNGIVTTGPSNLIIDCGATLTGGSASNYVVGNIRKNFCVAAPFVFPVGASGGYSPLDTDVTALFTNPSSLTVRVDTGDAGAIPTLDPLHTLNRYWTLTEGGAIQVNLLFHYLDGDVNGDETTYQLTKIEGTNATRIPFPGATVTPAANTIAINSVQNFSKWTATEPLAPTNTPALVGGHVVDNLGAPLAGVSMNLLDTVLGQNSSTITDTNGNYLFNAILTGREIVVTPTKNGFTFNPPSRAFGHVGDVANIDFVGTASSTANTVGSDFDGDGKADLSVFRPSDGTWYTVLSSTGVFKSQQWGVGTDKIVPADYDGDHVTDVAVFRPSNGTWYISQSSTSTLRAVNWGLADDVATPADFDGDGQADIAVWRPSNGTWYVIDSHNGQTRSIQWGTTGDRPVAADYDGDGTADFAVFRPSNGSWYVLKPDGNYTYEHWGIEEDRAVVGDYDGDHKADLAVFRPSTATWYIKQSSDNSIQTRGHGTAADVLVPADYDGDGKTDRAVWQTGGDWNILRSTTNTAYGQKWGTAGDIPTTSAYVR